MPTPSTVSGMGARPHAAGTSFRVWAPFADSVEVIGDFNAWSRPGEPLALEQGGYWSGDVANAEAGQEYKFLINGDLERADPYALAQNHSNGPSIIVTGQLDWTGDDFRMPPWNELVIYELHAGTFNDEPGGDPGTYDTLVEKLDYLRDRLSINALKIMPGSEFRGGFSLGYNPSHLFAIEKDYGGPDAFHRFVKAAHQRGMAVILDVVYNHLGPDDLDLKRFDGWSEEGHPDGIYFYGGERIRTPWGPRPDYGRAEVRQFIRDNVLYWLEEHRVDGLRFDATNYIRTINNDWRHIPDGYALLRWLNDEVDRKVPWKLMIAEDLQQDPAITRSTSEGGLGFDSQWDAVFLHSVRPALTATFDSDRNMNAVANALRHRYPGDAFSRVVYVESHDECGESNGKRRLVEDIWVGNAEGWAARKRAGLGAALVMTAPGIPMIFQGQESIEVGSFSDSRPLDRTRRVRFEGMVRLFGDLIRLRRNWFDNTRGLKAPNVNVFHVNDSDKVIAYHRWGLAGPGDDVVVVANFGNRAYSHYTLGFPRGGSWKVRFNGDASTYSADFGNHESFDTWANASPRDGLPASASVGLGPYTAVILSQDS